MNQAATSFSLLFLSVCLSAALAGGCSVDADESLGDPEGAPGGKADDVQPDAGTSSPDASTPTPDTEYEVSCWDGSFFYNKLRIDEQADVVKFNLDGPSVRIAWLHPNESGNDPANATLTFPRTACQRHATDQRLWHCQGTDVEVVLDGAPPFAIDWALVETIAVSSTRADGMTWSELSLDVSTNHAQTFATYANEFPDVDCGTTGWWN